MPSWDPGTGSDCVSAYLVSYVGAKHPEKMLGWTQSDCCVPLGKPLSLSGPVSSLSISKVSVLIALHCEHTEVGSFLGERGEGGCSSTKVWGRMAPSKTGCSCHFPREANCHQMTVTC